MNFISYATANDDPSFEFDMLNLTRMVEFQSGVSHVKLFIAISEVVDATSKQMGKIKSIIDYVNVKSKGRVHVLGVEFKSNLGRDFSSHALNLRKILKITSDDGACYFSTEVDMARYLMDGTKGIFSKFQNFQTSRYAAAL